MLIKAAKIKRYEDTPYKQNQMIAMEQKTVFKELNERANGEGIISDGKGINNFWWKFWSIEKEHNEEAEWLEELKRGQIKMNLRELVITAEIVKRW